MYRLSYGLFVVTAKEGDRDNGCITNTAGQVTTTPNRITLAVNKGNFTHDMILRTGEFTSHPLGAGGTLRSSNILASRAAAT